VTGVSPGVFLFVGIVVVVAVLVVGYVLDRKRRDRLMQYALMRGWTYAGEDASLVDRWQGEPFGRGDTRRARNVLTGHESGLPFTAFEYSYETHSTDSKGNRTSSTHHYVVAAVPMQGWLGTVQVLPESALDRMAGAVGLVQDIELESEDFNRRFRVSATSPKLASDILPPRTMAYLLSVQPPQAWRTCGSDLVGFAQGRLDPVDVVRTCAVLARVHSGVPPFVWKDAGGTGSGYSPGP
jgi:hypothetical protein